MAKLRMACRAHGRESVARDEFVDAALTDAGVLRALLRDAERRGADAAAPGGLLVPPPPPVDGSQLALAACTCTGNKAEGCAVQ